MRGMDSIAKAVTPAPASASRTSGRVRGARNPTSTELGPRRAISSGVGGDTFTTTSAPQGSPIWAPASVNAASGSIAPSPAPDSTTTSMSRVASLRITSGTSPTRRSPSVVSTGTPTRMRAGTVSRSARGHLDAAIVVHGQGVVRRERRLVERARRRLDPGLVRARDEPHRLVIADLRRGHEARVAGQRLRGRPGPVEDGELLAPGPEAGEHPARARAGVDVAHRVVARRPQLAPGAHEHADGLVVHARVDAAARGDHPGLRVPVRH